MEAIGTTIQTLRKNRSMTQAQLAEVLAVSAQSVSKWENHISTPDISLLPVIARYFGITMDELFHYRLDVLNYKERFIRFMADNNVLQFGEFPLQSGRISPYYIHTGNYLRASQITQLGHFYAECMHENHVESRLMLGNTHREIPIMIATGMVMYERYGMDIHYSTEYGEGKRFFPGEMATLIKDTLTTGNTIRANLTRWQEISRISHIIVSVDRMERGDRGSHSARREVEKQYGVKIHAIVTLADIIRTMEKGMVGGQEHLMAIRQYQERYGGDEYDD